MLPLDTINLTEDLNAMLMLTLMPTLMQDLLYSFIFFSLVWGEFVNYSLWPQYLGAALQGLSSCNESQHYDTI